MSIETVTGAVTLLDESVHHELINETGSDYTVTLDVPTELDLGFTKTISYVKGSNNVVLDATNVFGDTNLIIFTSPSDSLILQPIQTDEDNYQWLIIQYTGVEFSACILDLYDPVAAFSTRKVKQLYTGDCLELSNSSGNTFQIPFVGEDVDGLLIQTALSQGYDRVSKWYDQSGNGLDATQSTYSKMPDISLNVTPSGKASVRFNGGDNAELLIDASTDLDNLFSGKGYIASTLKVTSGGAGTYGRILSKGQDFELYYQNDTTIRSARSFSITNGRCDITTPAINQWITLGFEYESIAAAVPDVTIDGQSATVGVGMISDGTADDDSNNQWKIGSNIWGELPFDGHISELFFFDEVPA